MTLDKIIGKTITEVYRDAYGAHIHIKFSDGTRIDMTAGKDSCHNDSWSTVEFKIFE